jgi:nucleoside-triphosphatase THEP1
MYLIEYIGMTAIVTGTIDSGKTSFVRGLAVELAGRGLRVAGVLSPARLASGRKSLYMVEDLRTGEQRPLLERRAGGPRVLPGGFAFGNAALGRIRSGVAIVDEFGPLELAGGGYFAAARALTRRRGVHLLVVVRRGLVKDAAKALGLRRYTVVDLDARRQR